MTSSQASGSDGAPARPPLRVISGDATAEEIAAIVAVLAAASGNGDGTDGTRTTRSRWADPRTRMRAHLSPGPGAWRASALPR